MRVIDLKQAISEIKQVTEEGRKHNRPSPFFFTVGAGLSYPSVLLASGILQECKQMSVANGRGGDEVPPDISGQYSYWFQRAWPQPKQRQRYLRHLMEKASISPANLRLAHLLLDGTISNLVVTTNFDDLLSQALTLLGKRHIVCDHPDMTGRIDLDSEDIQIVHVHGSYWFYDCCNLTEEITRRAASCRMSQVLDVILRNRYPIVLGYGGWDKDAFMAALKKRAAAGFAFNAYWFCFRRAEIDGLPDWLKSHENVCLVAPAERAASTKVESAGMDSPAAKAVQARFGDSSGPLLSDHRDAEPQLSAIDALDALIQEFRPELPKLTEDPLEFYAQRLESSLIGDGPPVSGGDDSRGNRGYKKGQGMLK